MDRIRPQFRKGFVDTIVSSKHLDASVEAWHYLKLGANKKGYWTAKHLKLSVKPFLFWDTSKAVQSRT